jgi:hypothetical protein
MDVGGVKDERGLTTSLSIAQPGLGTTEFVSQRPGTENVPSLSARYFARIQRTPRCPSGG